MEIRECPHGREIIENCRNQSTRPRPGARVVMGYDGFLAWERWSAFKIDSDVDANADIIRRLLTEDIAAPIKIAGTSGPQSPGPCRSGFDAGRVKAGNHTGNNKEDRR